jgi:hypothetical protein
MYCLNPNVTVVGNAALSGQLCWSLEEYIGEETLRQSGCRPTLCPQRNAGHGLCFPAARRQRILNGPTSELKI